MSMMAKIRIKITEGHLQDTDNDSKLHFEGVKIVQLIGGSEPLWIESNGIDATLLLLGKLLNLCLIITAPKHIQR